MDGEKDGKLGTESLRWWTMSDPDLEFQPPNKMTRPTGFCFALFPPGTWAKMKGQSTSQEPVDVLPNKISNCKVS